MIQKRRAIKHVELVLSELEQCSASEGFVPGDLAITLFNALLTAFFNVELVRLCVIKTIKLFGFLGIRSQTMGSLEGFAADYERSTFILRNVLAPVKFAQELRNKLTERSFNFVAVLAAVFTALRFREKRRRVVGLTRASHSQCQEKQNQN